MDIGTKEKFAFAIIYTGAADPFTIDSPRHASYTERAFCTVNIFH